MSFQEIEVKILEVNVQELREKLTAMGGRLSFDAEMKALFFDTSAGSIKAGGDVLRLRQEGEEAVLAYKKHVSRGAAKVMEEIETRVEDPESMRKILEEAGLEVVKQTRKFRSQYELEDAYVVIDDYQDDLGHIPPFIEVEALSMARLEEVVKALGFSMEDCLNWSTRELAMHYAK